MRRIPIDQFIVFELVCLALLLAIVIGWPV
jgi:hypothetical protein